MPASVAPPMATSSTPSGSFERRPSGTQSPETRGQPQTGRGPRGRRRASRPAGRGPSSTPSRPGTRRARATPMRRGAPPRRAARRRPNERAPKMSNTERSKSRADTPRDCISRPHAPSAHDIGDGVPRRRGSPPPLRHPGGAGRVDHVGQRALGGPAGAGGSAASGGPARWSRRTGTRPPVRG